jgi:hypothetical protein
MHRDWLETLAAWLNPQQVFAWACNIQTPYRGNVRMGWDAAFPWEHAEDAELILHAALITAAHC